MPLVKHTYTLETATGIAISPDELKDHLNITGTYDDNIIGAIAYAANNLCEQWTWRAFVDSDWKLYLSEVPTDFYICKCPVNTVGSVKYYNTSDVLTTLVEGTDYIIGLESEPSVIKFLTVPNLSTKKIYPIVIELNCGWADYTVVPKQIKQAVLMTAANLYEMRTDNIVGISNSVDIPLSSKMLLANQRTNIY